MAIFLIIALISAASIANLFAKTMTAIHDSIPYENYTVVSAVQYSNSVIQHLPAPQVTKGIYLRSDIAGGPRFASLLKLVKETELNTMVIDIKNQDGSLAFEPKDPALKKYPQTKFIPLKNLESLIGDLHKHSIYAIARITVFFDPHFVKNFPQYAVKTKNNQIWRDYRGHAWLEPSAKEVWDYNAKIAKEAYFRGFDEIQFDYIRFPSDGPMSAMKYSLNGQGSLVAVMENFFSYLDHELRKNHEIPISADLFGLTFWMIDSDLNIGQKLEKTIPYFDFLSPMVYPSHYPSGYLGYKNPALYPYEVIYQSLTKSKTVYEKLKAPFTARPWIQDFDMGANYDAAMILKQIKAVTDTQGAGWLLWNARNVYTEDAFDKLDNS
ncbi:MAG: hypothetical protein HY602_00410 [Parcubacteria group bacterium]|nr:hypothetical protein [Parcubacteria group bacterium]